jgi:hypothetical protein
MDLDIDSLIIRPGMFVVNPDKRYRVTGKRNPKARNSKYSETRNLHIAFIRHT